jgi:hypothetical protein
VASHSLLISTADAHASAASAAAAVASLAATSADTHAATASAAASAASVAVSVLSVAVSVADAALSARIASVLSVDISALTSAHNALSALVDPAAISEKFSALSQALSVLSQAVSVLSNTVSSLGAGAIFTRVLSVEASVSTGLTAISGFSVSVDNGGIYRLEGILMYQTSAGQLLGFGLSFPTMTRATFEMRSHISVGQDVWTNQSMIPTLLNRVAVANETDGGSVVLSLSAGGGQTYGLYIEGLFVVGAVSGHINVEAKCSAGGVLLCRVGSYLRTYKIG